MKNDLVQQNTALLEQGIQLLREIPDRAYTSHAGDAPAPALGPHFRHCLEFFGCFFDGLDRRIVDYGSRARRRDLETDRSVAIRELERTIERLSELPPETFGQALELRREVPAKEGRTESFGSTIGRELQFLLSHTVHHYALIALALRLEGHTVPAEFGVAPSTLEHWRREGRVAS